MMKKKIFSSKKKRQVLDYLIKTYEFYIAARGRGRE
jgi:hypothetical protein